MNRLSTLREVKTKVINYFYIGFSCFFFFNSEFKENQLNNNKFSLHINEGFLTSFITRLQLTKSLPFYIRQA